MSEAQVCTLKYCAMLTKAQLHPCGGTAEGWYAGTKLPSYADQLGFILIYAGTTHMSNVSSETCFGRTVCYQTFG